MHKYEIVILVQDLFSYIISSYQDIFFSLSLGTCFHIVVFSNYSFALYYVSFSQKVLFAFVFVVWPNYHIWLRCFLLSLLHKQDEARENPDIPTLFRRFWKVAAPYWSSEDKTQARLRLASVFALTLATTGISVGFNFLGRDFYNALSSKYFLNYNCAFWYHYWSKFSLEIFELFVSDNLNRYSHLFYMQFYIFSYFSLFLCLGKTRTKNNLRNSFSITLGLLLVEFRWAYCCILLGITLQAIYSISWILYLYLAHQFFVFRKFPCLR